MNEIEVKILDADNEAVKETLLKNGAVLVKKENQENYIYLLPEALRNQNGYARIRRVHNLIDDTKQDIMCVKKILSQKEAKITEEHEFEISNFENGRLFLNALGIQFSECRGKYRESYSFNGALVEFDTWDKETFPDTYIEIEAPDISVIKEVCRLLNISEEKVTSRSLSEIKKDMGL